MTLALLAARDAAPLPMPWSRIKRVLDSMEARFVRGALRLQEARVRALEPLVERVLETGLVPALIPLEGDFPAMVADFAAEVLGEGLVHASADVRAEEQRARSAGVNLKVDGEPVVPKEALAFIESRRDLARFFDPDQVQKVRTILGNSLREGATVKQTMDALQTALPAASRARLENIARTEATAAYNQGRVYRFLQSQGFIVAVQFMATLDSRVTDICQHRNGLVFSLKDPRIRENTPPLHFQCRSILSPVSGYKLQKMGGQERLDKDARAMDDAPGVQVTKKGRFGNEPWPEAPGGAAPVPRATPVGPKVGPAAKVSDARKRPGRPAGNVDLLPPASGSTPNAPVDAQPGKSWRPKRSQHVTRPSGLSVYQHRGIVPEDGVAREVLKTIEALPQAIVDGLKKHGVKTWMLDEQSVLSLGPRPRGIREKKWKKVLQKTVQHGAVTLENYPNPGDITMIFVPPRLLARGDSPAWAARHEAGHAVYWARLRGGRRRDRKAFRDSVRNAFNAGRLLRFFNSSFDASEREFFAEGFAFIHGSPQQARKVRRLSPSLAAIVGSMDANLTADDGVIVLYDGPEGFAATGVQEGDSISFYLDLGSVRGMADILPDGTIICHGGGPAQVGPIHASWPETVVWTPEEAEPYKAFLRSKGITLPHVMS